MPQLRPKVAPAKKIQKMAVIPNLISRLIAISIKTWKLFLISPEIDKRSESHSACPTLCNPMDYTVHGVLQARILQQIAIPLARGSSQPRDLTQVSCIAGRFFTVWANREAHYLT